MEVITAQPVTELQNDELVDDYADMFEELLEAAGSLRNFQGFINSQYTHATWGKYKNGKMELNPRMKSELRRKLNLDPLPPTVADALSAVDDNGTVYQIGEEPPDTAAMWNEQESSVLCNLVTRGTAKRKAPKQYKAIDNMPKAVLAACIRNRVEM